MIRARPRHARPRGRHAAPGTPPARWAAVGVALAGAGLIVSFPGGMAGDVLAVTGAGWLLRQVFRRGESRGR